MEPQSSSPNQESKWVEKESGSELEADSASSESGLGSDPEQEDCHFQKRYGFELMSDLYNICRKIEKNRLEDKLGDRAVLTFKPNRTLQLRYNDDAVKEEVKKFIYSMIALPFDGKELSNRTDLLLHCRMLNQQLQGCQYYITHNGDKKISLYGVKKKKEQVQDKKLEIINNYMEVRYTQKIRFSQTEKAAYATIFERLRNFQTLVKKNDNIKWIEPFFRREQQQRKWTLKFFVKTTKKMDFAKLNEDITAEIASCRYIIVVLSKRVDVALVEKSKKYAFSSFQDQKANAIYGILAFRKKEFTPEDLNARLQAISDATEASIEGYRFFLETLDKKVKVPDLEKEAASLGVRSELFPKNKPYSITFTPHIIDSSFVDFKLHLMELAIYGKVKHEKVNTSNVLGEISQSEIQPVANTISQSTYHFQQSEVSMNKTTMEQQQYAEDKDLNAFLFVKKDKQRSKEVIGDSLYDKTPVECSKAFITLYNSNPEQEVAAIITGLKVGVLTKKNAEVFAEDIEVQAGDDPTGEKLFFKGFYKPEAFAAGNRCFTVKPVVMFEWKGKTAKLASEE